MQPTSLLDLLASKTEHLEKHGLWRPALVLLFLLVMDINGVSTSPYQIYQRLSQNPFVTRTDFGPANSWQDTVLLPVFAFATGLTSPVAFYFLCLVLIISAYALFAYLVSKHYPPPAALILSAILITSPLTTILLAWVGMPDGLTVLLTTPFLFPASPFWLAILAVLGTSNHIAFLFAALEILILRWLARDRVQPGHFVAAAAGGLLGLLSVRAFLTINHIQSVSRWQYIAAQTAADWLGMNLVALPARMFSLLNVQWLVVPACVALLARRHMRYYAAVLAAMLINCGVTFFTADTTRVFSLLSWGVLMACLLHSTRIANEDGASTTKRFFLVLTAIALVSLVAPRYYVWGPDVRFSPVFQFLSASTR